jgi:hypothetical protein
VSEKWDVYSWESRVGHRTRLHHGCFETKFSADRFIANTAREHPDRTYRLERCKHSDQAHAKAAGA